MFCINYHKLYLRVICKRESLPKCVEQISAFFFYIGILLVVLSIHFCEGNTISGRIPPCNKSLDMTVRANSSVDRILLSVHLSDSGLYMGATFSWFSEGAELCRVLIQRRGVCAKQKYHTEMYSNGSSSISSNGTHAFVHRVISYYFKFIIIQPNRGDSGLYFLQNNV